MQLYNQFEILHFQKNHLGGHAKSLSLHCMLVKVLGHTDLPFFIPTGLTALQMCILIRKWKGSVFATIRQRLTRQSGMQRNLQDCTCLNALKIYLCQERIKLYSLLTFAQFLYNIYSVNFLKGFICFLTVNELMSAFDDQKGAAK